MVRSTPASSKARFRGAGPACDLALELASARDVLVLVVIFEIDLAQAVRLGRAAHDIAPAGQRLPRRSAVGAAGQAAEFAGRRLRGRRLTELEVPDAGAAQILRAGDCRPKDVADCEHGQVSHNDGIQCRFAS
jgi:hypothetical protein